MWERSEESRNVGVLERNAAAGYSASELAVQNPGNSRLGGRVAGLEQTVRWEDAVPASLGGRM